MVTPAKYDARKQQPFNDPIVRCDSCQKILRMTEIRKIGKCKFCGNRRVRSVQTLNSGEMKLLEKWEIDPEFIALFPPMEGVDDD